MSFFYVHSKKDRFETICSLLLWLQFIRIFKHPNPYRFKLKSKVKEVEFKCVYLNLLLKHTSHVSTEGINPENVGKT